VRISSLAVIVAITLVTLVAYFVSVADAADALCFGSADHAAVEGAAEHQPSPVSSEGTGIAPLADHGPCVDVVMSASDGGKPVTTAPPAVAERMPVPTARGETPAVPRHDGRPLVPLSGFGSTLLRI
jgi:hypothetical protein